MKKTLKQGYEEHLARYNELMKSPMSLPFARPGLFYQKPFRMFGNLYYVGDKFVCAHLVDTGDGLLLFDSVNTGQGGMLINAIWEIGFNPRDIKWIIHSHGHLDHIGQAQFMKDMFGCNLYIGAPDAKMFRERPELSAIQESSNRFDMLWEPDGEIYDGDVLTFGKTTISFVITPGHTDGVLSCFFDVTDGKETKRAGYFGGFGFNTLQKDYLIEIGDPELKNREIYLDSLAKVREEHVDIFMANHPNNDDMLKKYEYMLAHPGENPFVDDKAWGRYLDRKRDDLLKMMEEEGKAETK